MFKYNMSINIIDKNNKSIKVIDKHFDKLYKFITTSPKKKILNMFYKNLNFDYLNDYKIDEGYNGIVYVPGIYLTITSKYFPNNINIPIIIKKLKNNIEQFSITEINKVLYINGCNSLITEMLILLLLRNFYNKLINLPLLLGYTMDNINNITQIILLKYGLSDAIVYDLSKVIINDNILWNNNTTNKSINTNLITFKELYLYLYYHRNNDDESILPNGTKCKISEICDYLCIAYLTTYQFLFNNNIYMTDVHAGNIFIHWLDDCSYFNLQNIKNVNTIVYKFNNKYYEIKTFGFVFIFGDTGVWYSKIKDISISSFKNITNNYDLIQYHHYYNAEIFYILEYISSRSVFKMTIAYKILQEFPYNRYSANGYMIGIELEFVKNAKSTFELMKYYNKYSVPKYNESNLSILINLD